MENKILSFHFILSIQIDCLDLPVLELYIIVPTSMIPYIEILRVGVALSVLVEKSSPYFQLYYKAKFISGKRIIMKIRLLSKRSYRNASPLSSHDKIHSYLFMEKELLIAKHWRECEWEKGRIGS